MTTTRLPFESESAACSACSRHTTTVKSDASPSFHPSPSLTRLDTQPGTSPWRCRWYLVSRDCAVCGVLARTPTAGGDRAGPQGKATRTILAARWVDCHALCNLRPCSGMLGEDEAASRLRGPCGWSTGTTSTRSTRRVTHGWSGSCTPSPATLLALHHASGLPVREIAELLSVPEGTAKARLARGRTALAALLADPQEVDLRDR